MGSFPALLLLLVQPVPISKSHPSVVVTLSVFPAPIPEAAGHRTSPPPQALGTSLGREQGWANTVSFPTKGRNHGFYTVCLDSILQNAKRTSTLILSVGLSLVLAAVWDQGEWSHCCFTSVNFSSVGCAPKSTSGVQPGVRQPLYFRELEVSVEDTLSSALATCRFIMWFLLWLM